MTHSNFRRLSAYLNETYRGGFTPAEVDSNADIYHSEYMTARHSDILTAIVDMMKDDTDFMPADILTMYNKIRRFI